MKYQKRCWVNHESWWTQQLPTQEEMDPGRRDLEKHGNRVDFVISHCLPQTVVYIFFQFANKADMMAVCFNDLMKNGLQIGAWYCGHYHLDQWLINKFWVLYHDIIRIV